MLLTFKIYVTNDASVSLLQSFKSSMSRRENQDTQSEDAIAEKLTGTNDYMDAYSASNIGS